MTGESGDLEIVSETTVASVPRGEREEVRLTFTRARTSRGGETAWHSLRLFYRAPDGSMRPGKQGLTIRGREIRTIAVGFLRAVSSSIPPALQESARLIGAALGGGRPAA